MHSIVTTFREAVIKVEVANFGAAIDTLIDQDAEGLARAENGEGSGKWEVGRVDRKEGGEGWMATGGWRQGGGIGRGQRGGGDGEGSNTDGKRLAMGRGTR